MPSRCPSALRISLALTLLLAAGCDRGNHPSEIGRPAPDFTVTDDARTVRLDNYRGRIVLLNFWASWCAPCIEELPSLLKFHHDHPEIAIIAISIDESPEAYKNFLLNRKVDFLTVRDPDQTTPHKYGVTGWPETFLIDRQGQIRRRFIGATDWSDPEIQTYLRTL